MMADGGRPVAVETGSAASPLPQPLPGGPADALRDERIRLFYEYLPVLAGLLIAGVAVVVVLWDVVSRRALLIWYGALVGAVALRAVWYWRYHRTTADRSHPRWAIYGLVGVLCTGGVWGIGALVLFPSGPIEYQLFILLTLVALTAGGVTSLSAYVPAFYVFLPVVVLPVNIYLLFQPDRFHRTLGIMGFVYVAALALFARTVGRSVVETLKLRFEKNDLIAELSRKKDEAERANVAKSKFLAAASHDLRQPLHALTLFTSALDERITYPEVRRIVDNINVSVGALEELFNALLDISRLDAGVMRPELRHFRLDELLTRLVNEHAPDAERKGLRLVCAPSELVVFSDPALLERILRNYVSNAIRYTEQGEVRMDIEARTSEARIVVSDTGIGIPASQHRDIFNEFHQLGNPERDRTMGLGLGLAIVERVARLLDYPIAVDSEPGKGSRFSVTVPIGQMAHEREEAPAREPQRDVRDLCVVVIDDELGTREGMRTLLEQWGCRVFTAGSEDEVLAAVRAAGAAPDAVLVDYRLREDRTGVQAIARLRAEFGADIPALIVTGDTAPERLREAQASGHPLVHKPVRPAVLRTFLRNAGRVTLSDGAV